MLTSCLNIDKADRYFTRKKLKNYWPLMNSLISIILSFRISSFSDMPLKRYWHLSHDKSWKQKFWSLPILVLLLMCMFFYYIPGYFKVIHSTEIEYTHRVRNNRGHRARRNCSPCFRPTPSQKNYCLPPPPGETRKRRREIMSKVNHKMGLHAVTDNIKVVKIL